MKIIVEEWKMSKSGKSANLFSGAEKYYMPLKKIALKVGDAAPEFTGAIFTLDEKDLITKDKSSWLRINKFKTIELKSGKIFEWKALLTDKREIFGNIKKTKVDKTSYEFINPEEW